MAFAQGKFGIEYNANPIDEESSGAGWLVAVIALAAVAVLAAAGVRRLISSSPDEPSPIEKPVAVQTTTPVATNAPPRVELPPPPPPPPLPPGAERNRPRVAQNLLLKLEKAEAAQDVELAVATIEQLRALPGEAVADLDNSLARRLDAGRRVSRDRRCSWRGNGRIDRRRLVGRRRNKPPHAGRRKDGNRREGNDDYEPTRARRLFVYRVCVVFDAELALGESH